MVDYLRSTNSNTPSHDAYHWLSCLNKQYKKFPTASNLATSSIAVCLIGKPSYQHDLPIPSPSLINQHSSPKVGILRSFCLRHSPSDIDPSPCRHPWSSPIIPNPTPFVNSTSPWLPIPFPQNICPFGSALWARHSWSCNFGGSGGIRSSHAVPYTRRRLHLPVIKKSMARWFLTCSCTPEDVCR